VLAAKIFYATLKAYFLILPPIFLKII